MRGRWRLGMLGVCMLAGSLSGWAGVWGDQPEPKAKQPAFIDCYADKVVIHPGATTVTWEELQARDNPVDKLLTEIEAHRSDRYLMILARPDSAKFYRAVRRKANQLPIDVGSDVMDAGAKFKWDEQSGQPAVGGGAIHAKPRPPTNKSPAFFECRGNEVFYIDKEGLDDQVQRALSTLPANVKSGDIQGFIKAVGSNDLGNVYYKVVLAYLLTAIMALEPRSGVHGEAPAEIGQPNSRSHVILRQLDDKQRYAVFLVRSDSFEAFRVARRNAEAAGFEVGWELLGNDEPIKFGSGGVTLAD